MKIENKTYDSFKDFFAAILPTGNMSNALSDFIFRGESTNKYKLIPSALRLENRDKFLPGTTDNEYTQIMEERRILKKFYRIANNNGLKVPQSKSISGNYIAWFPDIDIGPFKWVSKELQELAALAQHYGTITRLLDWTFDVHIALYFASIGAFKRAQEENIDADNMVIWALNAQYIQFLQPSTNRIPLNFIVPSYYDNPNINAQKGILSYWEIEMGSSANETLKLSQGTEKAVDRTPINELLEKHCGDKNKPVLLYKFEFPAKDYSEVLEVIGKLGYKAARIFPGYDGVTRQMQEQYLLDRLNWSRKFGA